jgi:hypothetical protein
MGLLYHSLSSESTKILMFFDSPVNPEAFCSPRDHLRNFDFQNLIFKTATNMVCLNAHFGRLGVDQLPQGLPAWLDPSRNLLRSTVSVPVVFRRKLFPGLGVQ